MSITLECGCIKHLLIEIVAERAGIKSPLIIPMFTGIIRKCHGVADCIAVVMRIDFGYGFQNARAAFWQIGRHGDFRQGKKDEQCQSND